VIVAGLGFRRGADVAALRAALAALGAVHIDRLATAADKADAAALRQLAAEMGVMVVAVDAGLMAAQPVVTHSARVIALRGTGSVAEAAALAAAGDGARLIAPRVISSCGMATAALAEGVHSCDRLADNKPGRMAE
jgi:cobalt-precorrin 5A hydrolase